MFPDEDEGDRIIEQLLYVPEDYQGRSFEGLSKYIISQKIISCSVCICISALVYCNDICGWETLYIYNLTLYLTISSDACNTKGKPKNT